MEFRHLLRDKDKKGNPLVCKDLKSINKTKIRSPKIQVVTNKEEDK
jgi:hypothetical protein